MAKSVCVCDQDADVAIKTMMAAVVGTAVIPAHVNWALTASAMCCCNRKVLWRAVDQR
mgnify:CR=1 FL=1